MKNVSFYLGPASGLASRKLTITPMPRAGQMPEDIDPIVDATLGGTDLTSVQEVEDDVIYEATLQDTLTGGLLSRKQVICFQTDTEQFPGPAAPSSESLFRILSIEAIPVVSSSSSSGA